MIIPEWLFQEPVETIIRNINNPNPLNQIAMVNIILVDKQLNEELAKKMNNTF